MDEANTVLTHEGKDGRYDMEFIKESARLPRDLMLVAESSSGLDVASLSMTDLSEKGIRFFFFLLSLYRLCQPWMFQKSVLWYPSQTQRLLGEPRRIPTGKSGGVYGFDVENRYTLPYSWRVDLGMLIWGTKQNSIWVAQRRMTVWKGTNALSFLGNCVYVTEAFSPALALQHPIYQAILSW